MRYATLISIAFLGACLLSSPVRADGFAAHEDADTEDAHSSVGHAHRFEIGLAPGLAYIPNDNAFALGLHLHLVAALPDTRWSFGVGAERLFDAHGHTTLSAVVQFRILDPWSVIVGPGLTIPDGEASDAQPSVHFETAYEFMFEHFHIGPSFEVAIDPAETHITLGMHFGVGF